jgi:hypothetical protein
MITYAIVAFVTLFGGFLLALIRVGALQDRALARSVGRREL